MLRGHILHGGTVKVMPLVARGHALQIAARAGVHAKRSLERIALKLIGMPGQQLLENPQLQWQKFSPKQLRIKLEKFFKHWLYGNQPSVAFWLGTLRCLRWLGRRI